MGKIIDEILGEIISLFEVGKTDNLLIKRTISKGYSGAEVYLIELKGESIYKGNFFLKIDLDGQEYENAENGYCFSKVARIVKLHKIQEYYVMLMEIAGKSLIEYQAFYELEGVVERKNAIEIILFDILCEETKDKKYVVGDIVATDLFKKHLSTKIEKNSALRKYLDSITRDKEVENVTGFLFPKDILLPNALAYALNDSLWEDKQISNMSCYVHGDLHGDNVFYCNRECDYALIDLALYHADGYIFFDTAYFELSLLLHDFLNIENIQWISRLCQMADKQWNLIDCNDKQVLWSIQECEERWIIEQCDEKFNYKDNLFESQYVARVLVGLNYAGKRSVNEETRRKAFLYACVYMKKLLELKHIANYSQETIEWNEIGSLSSNNEISKFLSDVDYFSNSQKYILVLGNEYDYEENVCEALSRIEWAGIVSFKRKEGIENILKKYKLFNVLTVEDDLEMLTNENLWCLYADGVEYIPSTLKENFPQWRKEYIQFLNDFSKKIDQVIAPDELQIIIDYNSFSSDYGERLLRFCESLDLIENMHVNISFILEDKITICRQEDFAQIDCTSYNTNIESIAEFCLKYLKGLQEDEITIPALSDTRKVIPEADYKFIKSYVILLHNRIVQYEGQVAEIDKRAFYYGKEILWQSIEEKLYIERIEIAKYEKIINQEIEKDENQFEIKILHAPGAGASLLCRVLAWKYRNSYPVVLAKCMHKNINESIQKIYSVSGKRILLFVDGDFNENDVVQLMKRAQDMGIKIGIIFSCRGYGNTDSQMSTLCVDDGIKFSSGYTLQMRKIMNYPEEIILERSKNMHNLATKNSLINYRMPFFFGVNAFEKDLVSIREYLDRIAYYIDGSNLYQNIINYIALITYYTEGEGLSVGYVKKILNINPKTSIKEILKEINGEISNFIYYSNGNFKVCHSVVALEILKHKYEMNTMEFEEFLEKFVQDICSCEKKEKISNRLNELLMNLFIKRDIEGDIANNLQKKNFSPIILALENSNLQEKFFSFLVKSVPNNSHFRQHYGRLIIYNDPGKLGQAKEQFDEAIRLDPFNPLHYHARGNMYTKYVMNLCKNKYKNNEYIELYDEIASLTEEAIYDYEISIQLINENAELTIDLSYPYASIVQTITYVVHQLFLRYDSTLEEKDFLLLDNSISKWCRKYVQKAEQYDLNTENRYDSVRNNEVYNKVRAYLTKYKSTHADIAAQLLKNPDDIQLIKDYLFTLDTKKDKWENKTQEELNNIIDCSRKLMKDKETNSEGIMWRWFNACLNYKKTSTVEMLGLLETFQNADTSLTIQFMLYTIKVGNFLKNFDSRIVSEINVHINNCKRLSGNSNRTNTRYYYNAKGEVGFCYDKEDGVYVNGTVIRWDSPQNGHVSLEANSKLTAFFVPSIINMREEGAVGTKVKFKIGVSFDGLRAWDMEIL